MAQQLWCDLSPLFSFFFSFLICLATPGSYAVTRVSGTDHLD